MFGLKTLANWIPTLYWFQSNICKKNVKWVILEWKCTAKSEQNEQKIFFTGFTMDLRQWDCHLPAAPITLYKKELRHCSWKVKKMKKKYSGQESSVEAGCSKF